MTTSYLFAYYTLDSQVSLSSCMRINPNLVREVSLTRPSLQISGKTQMVVFPISKLSDHSLIKENCHNSRTIDDIDMKLGPVTKPDKRYKTTSKKLAMTSSQKL